MIFLTGLWALTALQVKDVQILYMHLWQSVPIVSVVINSKKHFERVSFFSAGLRALKTVWAEHISEECKRRFYKNWCVF